MLLTCCFSATAFSRVWLVAAWLVSQLKEDKKSQVRHFLIQPSQTLRPVNSIDKIRKMDLSVNSYLRAGSQCRSIVRITMSSLTLQFLPQVASEARVFPFDAPWSAPDRGAFDSTLLISTTSLQVKHRHKLKCFSSYSTATTTHAHVKLCWFELIQQSSVKPSF